jgi:phage-related tail protein
VNIWLSTLVTVAANGILIFLFQQYVNFRFSKLTDLIERERTYSTRTYEAVSQSSKAIWRSLTEMERFVIRDLPAQFASGHVGDQWDVIYTEYANIRGEMLVLPETLMVRTETTIAVLQNDINNFMAIAKQLADWQHQGKQAGTRTENEWLDLINEALQAAQDNFKKNLRSLRDEYQSTVRSLLIGPAIEKQRLDHASE